MEPFSRDDATAEDVNHGSVKAAPSDKSKSSNANKLHEETDSRPAVDKPAESKEAEPGGDNSEDEASNEAKQDAILPEKSLNSNDNEAEDVLAPGTSDERAPLLPSRDDPETSKETAEKQSESSLNDDHYHNLVKEYSRLERRDLIEKMGKDTWKKMNFQGRYNALVKEYGKKAT